MFFRQETESILYLIRHLLGAPATLFSINRFHNELKLRGVAGCWRTWS